MQKHTETSEKQIREIGNEVPGCFGFDRKRKIAPPNAWQELLAGLDRPLGPAMLLRLKTVHVDRQFRRRHHVSKENEFPAHELRAIAKIEIFAKRVVLPAAGFFNARFSPKSGGAIEVEKPAAAAARG